MTVQTQVQYVSDEAGRAVGVIVPIELWREIESERETAYLLKSEAMKKRLNEALHPTAYARSSLYSPAAIELGRSVIRVRLAADAKVVGFVNYKA